jgi:hypothetical protein
MDFILNLFRSRPAQPKKSLTLKLVALEQPLHNAAYIELLARQGGKPRVPIVCQICCLDEQNNDHAAEYSAVQEFIAKFKERLNAAQQGSEPTIIIPEEDFFQLDGDKILILAKADVTLADLTRKLHDVMDRTYLSLTLQAQRSISNNISFTWYAKLIDNLFINPFHSSIVYENKVSTLLPYIQIQLYAAINPSNAANVLQAYNFDISTSQKSAANEDDSNNAYNGKIAQIEHSATDNSYQCPISLEVLNSDSPILVALYKYQHKNSDNTEQERYNFSIFADNPAEGVLPSTYDFIMKSEWENGYPRDPASRQPIVALQKFKNIHEFKEFLISLAKREMLDATADPDQVNTSATITPRQSM